MGNLWLKIKIWTKVSLFALLTLAVLIFLFQNVNKPVKLWLWNEIDTTLLKAMFFTALISVLFTILLSTTLRTIRQIQELRVRNRANKLEPKLSKLTIQVQSTATGERVSKDAVEISAAEWGTAVPTDPGDHVVEATAPGKKAWRSSTNCSQGS